MPKSPTTHPPASSSKPYVHDQPQWRAEMTPSSATSQLSFSSLGSGNGRHSAPGDGGNIDFAWHPSHPHFLSHSQSQSRPRSTDHDRRRGSAASRSTASGRSHRSSLSHILNTPSPEPQSASSQRDGAISAYSAQRPLDRKVSHTRTRKSTESTRSRSASMDRGGMGRAPMGIKQELIDPVLLHGEAYMGIGAGQGPRRPPSYQLHHHHPPSDALTHHEHVTHTFDNRQNKRYSAYHDRAHAPSIALPASLIPAIAFRPNDPAVQVKQEPASGSSASIAPAPSLKEPRVSFPRKKPKTPGAASRSGVKVVETPRTGHAGGTAWTSDELLLAFHHAVKNGAPGSEKAWEGVVPGKTGNAVRMAWRKRIMPMLESCLRDAGRPSPSTPPPPSHS